MMTREKSLSFHTTMVFTQHEEDMSEYDDELLFPYHYGSHATK